MQIGDKFNRWEVLELPKKAGYHWKAFCKCKCGTLRGVNTINLTRGHSKSCGCLTIERIKAALTTHGMADKHPLYAVWLGMIARCRYANHIAYKNYGGRGIKVCDRWHKFENFLFGMGERPFKGASLDRINNDGNYEPSNVRWATRQEQNRYKRTARLITLNGITLDAQGWECITGIPARTIRERLAYPKWSIEEVLNKPKRIIYGYA